MVVFEYVAAGFRYGVQLVIGKCFPEKFASGTAGAFELVVGICHSVGSEDGF